MNLILQAIKAMLRGTRNSVDKLKTDTEAAIADVRNRLQAAQLAAELAQRNADDAFVMAENCLPVWVNFFYDASGRIQPDRSVDEIVNYFNNGVVVFGRSGGSVYYLNYVNSSIITFELFNGLNRTWRCIGWDREYNQWSEIDCSGAFAKDGDNYYTKAQIDTMLGSYITDIDSLIGGDG